MCDTAFWRGMAAGMAAGAIIGMTVAEKRKAMKTCVGRTMQQMGTAVDGALSDLMHRRNRRESAKKGRELCSCPFFVDLYATTDIMKITGIP